MSAMVIPINKDFSIEPIINGDIALLLFIFTLELAIDKMTLPSIIIGMISGIAATIGLPVIKKENIGVTIDIAIPYDKPEKSTVSMIQALTIEPVR